MIITRTPLRISFAGGGTDLPSFYRTHDGGAVVSAAIDRFVHVIVNEKFDASIRVAYSRTENVGRLDDLQHELVREAMRITGVGAGTEVHTVADIPGEGTGLGSSSSVTVGLLNALYAFTGRLCDAEQLAAEACRIEIDILGGTIGKQDQYIAAYGGLQQFEFRPDDSVRVTPLPLSAADRESLTDHVSLFYTGVTRKAGGILKEQDARTGENKEALLQMRALVPPTRDAMLARDWPALGRLLDDGWQLKRGLATGITNPEIDRWFAAAKSAGAYGGKVTGAGGGGFLLLVHPPERSHQIAAALSPMTRLPVRIVSEGSRILGIHR